LPCSRSRSRTSSRWGMRSEVGVGGCGQQSAHCQFACSDTFVTTSTGRETSSTDPPQLIEGAHARMHYDSRGEAHMNRFRSVAFLFTAVALTVAFTAVLIVKRASAASIVKSKSNVANNRMAAPIGTSAPGPWDVVVLCSSCGYPPATPEEGCLILMDSQTGEIWAYCDDAIASGKPPIHLGTLQAVGKPIKLPPK
jgi:hypothetical protein